MSGAARILRYNWPAFAATWTGALVAVVVAASRFDDVGPIVAALLVVGAAGAVAWSCVALFVSHWVYDRSPLSSARWVPPSVAQATTWATIDAGLDGEVALDDVLRGTCVARLDIYDGDVVRAPSVKRARRSTPRAHAATPSRVDTLALPDGACDVVAVVFTAHEIRDAALRERFFFEVRRALGPGGRMLIVEHLRDAANFVAFGPGFFHFQPRREWLRLARHANLRVVDETRVTPFVMSLVLEKPA